MSAARRIGLGLGTLLLLVLAGVGIGLVIYRFRVGLGPVSNLSQDQPWGLWGGLHGLAIGGLAAGCLIVGGLTHIFGGPRRSALVRPVVVAALVGYLSLGFALLVDLGRPGSAWQQLINWQPGSPLLVAVMCILFATAALILAAVPIFLPRPDQPERRKAWARVSSGLAILLLVAFAALVIHGQPKWAVWVVALAALLVLFEALVSRGVIRRDPESPTLLLSAGVIFGVLHQAALGAVALLAGPRFDPLWISPWLPLLLVISAVTGGLAVLALAVTFGGRLVGWQIDPPLLRGLTKVLGWSIVLDLAARATDLGLRRLGSELLSFEGHTLWVWIEVALGLLLPLAVLLIARSRGLSWASLLVVAGLIANRLGMILVAGPVGRATYQPRWSEVVMSVGMVAATVLAFVVACRLCSLSLPPAARRPT